MKFTAHTKSIERWRLISSFTLQRWSRLLLRSVFDSLPLSVCFTVGRQCLE